MAKDRRPGAIVRIKERLNRERRDRKVVTYAFPLQGGAKDSPSNWAKHKNKTHHLGEPHFMCHVLDRFAADSGLKSNEVWSDSVHPTVAAQEYLRRLGLHYAEEWSRSVGRPIPSAEDGPLIIIMADGWNSLKQHYFEFRWKFELCATVGEIMDLEIPPTAFIAGTPSTMVLPAVAAGLPGAEGGSVGPMARPVPLLPPPPLRLHEA